MQQDSRGLSYWSLRRKIRQHVAAAMTAFDADVCDSSANSTMPGCDINNIDYFAEDSTNNFLTEDTDDDDGDLLCDHVHCDEMDLTFTNEFSNSSSEDLDDTDNPLVNDTAESLKDSLIEWVASFNIPSTAVTALLKILHNYHPNLPLDSRTLMKTPRAHDISALTCGGELWYHGIAAGIEEIYYEGMFDAGHDVFYLQMNVDGLPLFKSSGLQLWPILCRIVGCDVPPFVVAVYCGFTKPADITEYLADFVKECKTLISNGIVLDGVHFNIVIHSFVCDAPARSFLKCVKSHNAYFGCERCCVQGAYVNNRMLFLDYEAQPRTDQEFITMTDDDHHVKLSPLAELPIGMVSNFVLDPMHLLYLGVMRKLLNYWVKGPLSVRLGSRTISVLSERLVSLKRYTPREFARKPRSLSDLDRWKATEFKLFLLYCGIVVLKDQVSEDVYNSFLLLFVSCRILSSAELVTVSDMCNYAESLLVLFVQYAEKLYGRDCLVYNMHSLIHLVADVRKYGSLENISAFVFENKLKNIKRMVRKPQFPLQQIIRRLSEGSHISHHTVKRKPLLLKRQHFHGPLTSSYVAGEVEQFGHISCSSFMLSLTVANNCALTVTSEPVVICNILSVHGSNIILVCRKFSVVDILFDYPVSSQEIQVYKVSSLKQEFISLDLHEIKCKCMRLPLFTQGNTQELFQESMEVTFPFAIVEFPEPKGRPSCAVVPSVWLIDIGETARYDCHWPPFNTSSKIAKAVESQQKPGTNWQVFRCRILKKFANYVVARSMLNRALDTSDFSDLDDAAKVRKRRAPRDFDAESDSDIEGTECNKRKDRRPVVPAFPRRSVIEPEPEMNENKVEITPALSARESTSGKGSSASSASGQLDTKTNSRRGKTPIVAFPHQSETEAEPERNDSETEIPPASSARAYTADRGNKGSSALSASGQFHCLAPGAVGISAVYAKLVEVQQQVLHLTKVVQKALPGPAASTNLGSYKLPEGVTLPLTTVRAVADVERLLLNAVGYTQLAKYLSQIGGLTIEDSIRRILQSVMTADLARQYSFHGRGSKIAFSGLKLKSVVYDAVRLNPVGKPATDSCLDKLTATWLVNARDRCGGRKQRYRLAGQRCPEPQAQQCPVDDVESDN